MASKVLFTICALVVLVSVSAQFAPGGAAWPPAGAVNPWLPPWVSSAPWYPQFAPCTTVGVSCLDCNTKMICTKIGGLQRACTDPTMPYCNLGECSATPTAECAPAPAAPASSA